WPQLRQRYGTSPTILTRASRKPWGMELRTSIQPHAGQRGAFPRSLSLLLPFTLFRSVTGLEASTAAKTRAVVTNRSKCAGTRAFRAQRVQVGGGIAVSSF